MGPLGWILDTSVPLLQSMIDYYRETKVAKMMIGFEIFYNCTIFISEKGRSEINLYTINHEKSDTEKSIAEFRSQAELVIFERTQGG